MEKYINTSERCLRKLKNTTKYKVGEAVSMNN